MYSLAIVEDELITRKCIHNFINAEECHISNIIEAGNSMEALEKFKTNVPDIMLVDIKMPGMNGLDLIRKVEESINPHVKSIIVSAYSDFDYSKEAIHLKVNDYLLKPVKKQDLLLSPKKVTDELKKMSSLQTQLKKNEKLSIGKLLQDFIQGRLPDEKQVNEVFTRLGFKKSSKYVALSVRFVCIGKKYFEKWCLLEKDLEHASKRFLYPDIQGVVVPKNKREYIVIIDAAAKVLTDPDNGFKMFIDYFNLQGCTISIGIGTTKINFKNLISSSLEASRSAREFLLQGLNKSFSYISIVPSKEYESLEGCYQMQNELLECIQSGSRQFRPIIHSLFNMDMYNSFYKFEIVFDVFVKSLQLLCNSLSMEVNLILDAELMKNNCQSMDELKAWLLTKIENVIIEVNQNMQHSTTGINKALDYIHAHYVQPLTLEDMSSICYMSQTYFCEVFKKQTGKTFIEYLNSLRLHKASQLLTDTDMRIYQISEAVGYNHVNYFTKQFTRFFGVKPVQYRKKRFSNGA